MNNNSRFLIFVSFITFNLHSFSQSITVEQYIARYKDIAIREMKIYKIPASITLAQGIHESANGNSTLAQKAYNHFGIKCQDNWTGETYFKSDDKEDECFRKYRSAEESYRDHSEFIKARTRYAFLFELNSDDYEGWAKGLKIAGYATNPKYPELLINTIEKYKLNEFDKNTDNIYVSENKNDINVKHKFQLFKRKKSINSPEFIEKKGDRDIILKNNIKAILANTNDNADKIANEMDMFVWQILKYNDLKANDTIHNGEIIYLQPKKNKAREDYHIVAPNESLRSISQLYGIKFKSLLKKNNMNENSVPQIGQKIFLRKKIKQL